MTTETKPTPPPVKMPGFVFNNGTAKAEIFQHGLDNYSYQVRDRYNAIRANGSGFSTPILAMDAASRACMDVYYSGLTERKHDAMLEGSV